MAAAPRPGIEPWTPRIGRDDHRTALLSHIHGSTFLKIDSAENGVCPRAQKVMTIQFLALFVDVVTSRKIARASGFVLFWEELPDVAKCAILRVRVISVKTVTFHS